jgi:hypothetical protein
MYEDYLEDLDDIELCNNDEAEYELNIPLDSPLGEAIAESMDLLQYSDEELNILILNEQDEKIKERYVNHLSARLTMQKIADKLKGIESKETSN